MFIDVVKIHVKGGRGGNGVTAFSRQPFEPKGPPSGGDGGSGGSVVLRATSAVATLVDFHHRPHRSAGSGRHGEGDLRRGADGADEVLTVPVGTVVKDADGRFLTDLRREGDEYTAAAGGRGGRGNASFRNARRRAPRFHEFGEPPQERWIVLELKLAADVALVGFPNAGKSSVIARLSAARPKIADYPFTTLTPNLGVVRADDTDFVVADVPGLIAGASGGRGLGHEFLRHVERAGVLVHVLDCASYEQRDPRDDLATVCAELRAYGDRVGGVGTGGVSAGGSTAEPETPPELPGLLERPALVFLNKADVAPETAELVRPDLEREGWEVLVGSAVTGEGMGALRYRMAALVELVRSQRHDDVVSERPVLRPAGRADRAGSDFEVERTSEGFRVRGERVERWVVMSDLDNEEAARYLQSRLARAGVERALVGAGARTGDLVEIAGAVFDFAPEQADLPAEERTGGAVDDDLDEDTW